MSTPTAARLHLPMWAQQPFSRTAGRVLLMAAGALLLARIHLAWRPATLCPLRAITGIPCPLCGGTTAAAAIGRLDLRAGLAANPVAVLAAAALGFAPLGPGRQWRRLSPRTRWVLIGVFVLVAWGWELRRFGVIG